MKNILFYYDNYCGESSHGGTEVATFRIARALKDTGKYRVFNAYKHRRDNNEEEVFTRVIKLDGRTFARDLSLFINDNNIDAVVNMGRFFRHNKLRKAIDSSGRKVKLLFMHHFAPGSEITKGTWKSGLHLLKMEPSNPLYWLRATVYPLLKLPRRLKYPAAYRNVYEASDTVVLLSESYGDEYMKFSSVKDKSKFKAIPNIYEPTELPSLSHKEKKVLVLSRMDEIQKRISLILDVWKKIEEIPDLNEWELDIVGTGHDYSAIRKYASRKGLKRVNFHGWQKSAPFLERSPILMSTSLYEGLSLAMIEAQTYGCVPIVFASYSSIGDIVKDGVSGFSVTPFGDTEAFARKLCTLMKNEPLRKELTANAMKQIDKFSAKHVADEWMKIL